MARQPKTDTTEPETDAAQAGADAAAEVLPSALVMTSGYGFFDEFGDEWGPWRAGRVVRNPYVVELLLSRNAPAIPVE